MVSNDMASAPARARGILQFGRDRGFRNAGSNRLQRGVKQPGAEVDRLPDERDLVRRP